ncbi:MAG: 2-succinyl-5-enolpyruvyl-6-hydroxy-3-cyclohexene-1-carboxylic-acid synthase [Bacilli bacterium]|nr:2-succinyl-5-enolpyruvyl-6-hydroxy-3-cyclohexene-1-carboxylic-acid synthase [Bacilli bacterium]
MNNKYLSNKILIELLKKYGIKKLVLSSGCRNVPFVSNVETDPDFECFSVIDERNAAFFGMGLSEEAKEPVAIACTSGTAASNYVSGVTEAYYSKVPLVVLTFDRHPYMYNQLETQKIDQESIFESITKKSVTLPIIKDEEDVWYCNRLINEAFIEMTRHGVGPVHINVPLAGDMNSLFNDDSNKMSEKGMKKINYVSTNNMVWLNKVEELLKTKKVLFILGQDSLLTDKEKEKLRKFAEIMDCPILTDNLSNFKSEHNILAGPIIKALNSKTINVLLPEIVISYGNNMQERIKEVLRGKNIKHWYITPDGKIRDCFKALDTIFECSINEFLDMFNKNFENKYKPDKKYFEKWKNISESIKLPEMPFTNFYVAKEFSKIIPHDSLLHLSILNATRQMQFFNLDESIKVFSNVNAFGIDGCLPTFMGQAYATDNLAFIMIGDLSFFYGMNALSIKHRKKNIRVLMINNGGGAEFHIQPDSNSIPTIDLHIGAAHNRTAKEWAISSGYKYLTANDKESFDKNIKEFISSDSKEPIFYEVFTDMKTDGEFCLSVYRYMEESIKDLLKED